MQFRQQATFDVRYFLLDVDGKMCYNKQVAGRESTQEKRQKPHHSVIFGAYRRERRRMSRSRKGYSRDIRENEKLLKKLFKNLLTNSRRCGIINKLSERRELNRANEAKAANCILKTEQCLKGKKNWNPCQCHLETDGMKRSQTRL